jgi:uncharacterized protein YkwD
MIFAPIWLAAALHSTDIDQETIELPQISTRRHSTRNETGDENRLLGVLNAERIKRGLGRLRLNKRLANAARSHSTEMANEGYFGHTSPSGFTCFQRMARFGVRVDGNYAGENIALDSNVKHAEAAMMASPGHRKNMLNPRYTEVGIAVVKDQDGTRYYSEDFLGSSSTRASTANSRQSATSFQRNLGGDKPPSGLCCLLSGQPVTMASARSVHPETKWGPYQPRAATRYLAIIGFARRDQRVSWPRDPDP